MFYSKWALYNHAGCGSSKEHKQNVSVKGKKEIGGKSGFLWTVYTTWALANLYTATQSITLNDHGPKSRLRKRSVFQVVSLMPRLQNM